MSELAERYRILRPDTRRGAHRSVEELLEDYVAMLNPLIEAMAGADDAAGADVAVFLDKSARPLAWMIRALGSHVAPQRSGEGSQLAVVRPMPAMRFVRIDRLAWRLDRRRSFAEAGMRPVTDDEVRGLRAVFQIGTRNELDGRRLLVIDEQSETGDTLRVARILFEKAFPTSQTTTMRWINSRIDPRTGHPAVVKIPAWYPLDDALGGPDDPRGRGVFDPVPYESDRPAHGPRFPPESYPFLCTPAISEPGGEARASDPASMQLRLEVRRLVEDFLAGRIHPLISTERETIRGVPALEYGLAARAARESRLRS